MKVKELINQLNKLDLEGEIKIRYDLCYLMEPEAILVDHDIREYPDGIKDVKYIFDVW